MEETNKASTYKKRDLKSRTFQIELAGGILLLLAGPVELAFSIVPLMLIIQQYHLSIGILGINMNAIYIRTGVTILWGALGVIGALLGKKKAAGHVLCLIVGILAFAGMVIPITAAVPGNMWRNIILPAIPPITLSTSFIYIDPVFSLSGGVMGIVQKRSKVSTPAISQAIPQA